MAWTATSLTLQLCTCKGRVARLLSPHRRSPLSPRPLPQTARHHMLPLPRPHSPSPNNTAPHRWLPRLAGDPARWSGSWWVGETGRSGGGGQAQHGHCVRDAAFPTDTNDSLQNPDLGPFLLKPWYWARVAPPRVLEFAERAARVLERRGEGTELELAMNLHIAAGIHCGLSHQALTL